MLEAPEHHGVGTAPPQVVLGSVQVLVDVVADDGELPDRPPKDRPAPLAPDPVPDGVPHGKEPPHGARIAAGRAVEHRAGGRLVAPGVRLAHHEQAAPVRAPKLGGRDLLGLRPAGSQGRLGGGAAGIAGLQSVRAHRRAVGHGPGGGEQLVARGLKRARELVDDVRLKTRTLPTVQRSDAR